MPLSSVTGPCFTTTTVLGERVVTTEPSVVAALRTLNTSPSVLATRAKPESLAAVDLVEVAALAVTVLAEPEAFRKSDRIQPVPPEADTLYQVLPLESLVAGDTTLTPSPSWASPIWSN